jgi:hypothetical protein
MALPLPRLVRELRQALLWECLAWHERRAQLACAREEEAGGQLAPGLPRGIRRVHELWGPAGREGWKAGDAVRGNRSGNAALRLSLGPLASLRARSPWLSGPCPPPAAQRSSASQGSSSLRRLSVTWRLSWLPPALFNGGLSRPWVYLPSSPCTASRDISRMATPEAASPPAASWLISCGASVLAAASSSALLAAAGSAAKACASSAASTRASSLERRCGRSACGGGASAGPTDSGASNGGGAGSSSARSDCAESESARLGGGHAGSCVRRKRPADAPPPEAGVRPAPAHTARPRAAARQRQGVA